uniref:uncharacterized protein n=1 Tax=Semicossyphus pulcher TaxID=241346 RepID=UPI0037E735A6
MEIRYNERRHQEHIAEGRHLKLKDLTDVAQGLENRYLSKGILTASPQPEFRVTHLKHDTNQAGLWGIRRKKGFTNPGPSPLLWWSLVVGPEEIESAERRFLENTYPDRTEEQVGRQQSFLEKFASSPAFQRSSRLGSYRITLSLEEVLKAYSEQFCSGAAPSMRVLRTVLYKQEVMYVVLVHSPATTEMYSYHPLLSDVTDYVCTYKDGCFLWRPQAMSETHSYNLVQKDDEKQMEARMVCNQFYVWEHVAVALHVDDQVLNFNVNRLREKLTFCEKGKPILNRNRPFDNFTKAEKFVKRLWPDSPSPLERAEDLH